MPMGFESPESCVVPTTQAEVMLAIVKRIRETIPQFRTETTCFLSDTVAPRGEVTPTLFCTVSPAGGDYGQDVIGGGPWGIEERLTVAVGVWQRMKLDRQVHSDFQFTDSTRGLFVLKHRVLTCLAGQQLYRDDDHPLLEQVLSPRHAAHPPMRDDEFASFAIHFDATFRWDVDLPAVT